MQDRNDEKTLQCIEYIYQTIDDPAQWQAVLHLLSEYVHNGKASISSRNNQHGHVELLDPTYTKTYGFSQEYMDKYIKLSQLSTGLYTQWVEIEHTHSYSTGRLCIYHDHLPLSELKETKFYTEWLSPQEISSGVALRLFNNKHFRIVLSIVHDEDPSSENLKILYDVLIRLAPHLSRAISISMNLEGISDTASYKGRSDYLKTRYHFSNREIDVVSTLVRLKSVKDIANTLYISENTVKFHIKSIKDKMGVSTSHQMMLRLFSVIDSGQKIIEE